MHGFFCIEIFLSTLGQAKMQLSVKYFVRFDRPM